jgi:hypothetical protein
MNLDMKAWEFAAHDADTGHGNVCMDTCIIVDVPGVSVYVTTIIIKPLPTAADTTYTAAPDHVGHVRFTTSPDHVGHVRFTASPDHVGHVRFTTSPDHVGHVRFTTSRPVRPYR